MRRWLLGLAVAVVAAGTAAADDKAAAVVKKAIEAHGGADNLNKYKAGKLTMKGDMSVMGNNLEFTGSLAYSLPDRYRLNIDTNFGGMKLNIHQVVVGDKVKSTIMVGDMTLTNPGGEAEVEELKTATVMQEAEQLTPLLDAKRFTVTATDDADVNGKKAAGILVEPKAGKKNFKMYFDKESGLLVKTSHRGHGPGEDGQGAEVDEDSYHSEYKKVNGVPVATKLVVNHDGKKFMTVNMSDIELLEKIDDKEFKADD